MIPKDFVYSCDEEKKDNDPDEPQENATKDHYDLIDLHD